MLKWFSKTQFVDVLSPLQGSVVSLDQVPDEAFAQKMMGDGVAVKPEVGRLTAPFDGTIAHLIDTNHAVIVEHASGLQLLLHIGINTVALNGRGFKAHVQSGDQVKAGQLLIEFDPDVIGKAGYSTITPVVIATEELVSEVQHQYGTADSSRSIMKITLKK